MKRAFLLALFFVFLLATIFLLSLSQAQPSLAAGEIWLGVHYLDDWAYTETDPNTEVTFTVTGQQGVKATLTGTTDDEGGLWTGNLEWDPENPDIEPGDGVKVTTNGSTAEVDPVGTISSTKDADKDTISGVINGTGQTTVTVTCEVWEGEERSEREIANVIGENGTFTCDFSQDDGTGTVDIQPEDEWNVIYIEDDGDRVYRFFSPPWVRANYSHDWAGINYQEGHTFTVTLKDSGGAVKGIATSATTVNGGWGSAGFDTQSEDWASGSNPDIVPGDIVVFESDDGYSNTLQVGTINGILDLDADSVDGTLNVPWLSGFLPVRCDIWTENSNAPGKDSSAAADGSTAYSCAWDTEWDIMPGDQVAVMYSEPDNDLVIRVFEERVPNLNVQKNNAGSNEATPGGTSVFQIDIYNGGQVAANTVAITDTLPVDSTYVADSLGVAPVIDGDRVIWEVNDLGVEQNLSFYVVTENSAEDGDTLTNEVEAFAEYEEYPDDNYGAADVAISTADPDLSVDLGAHPGNPVRGETFLYQVNYNNNNSTPSGEAILELEMPDVVTFVAWESRNGYDLWEGFVVNDVLTLAAPAVPGNWGDELRVRVRLDEGLDLDDCYNARAVIGTSNDSDPGNNESENEFCVGEPRADGNTDKRFHWGRLYPGGDLEYGMSVGNGGNVATETTLMDVLPVGTTLDYATIWEGGNNVPFPPDSNENGVLTWDMGELEPGAGFDINLRLNIDKDARPYSPFDNCIKVAIADTDVRPFDNEDCVEDTLQPAGPNVRVTKEHRWHDGETGLEYQLNIMNLGSTNLENVQVVDTYPEGVSFNGEWWHDLWEDVQLVDHDEEQRTLTWEISRMDPSWSFRIWFDVELDGDKVGVEGLTFTNVVDMPVTGDVNPDDNSDSDVAVTGPDLYIKKWLKDPSKIVKPGDDVAFVIEFGNASHRWGTRGDTLIEDQLPDGMTFVSATDPDDYTQEWDPRQDGNELQWFWGDIGDDNTWFFELTVKIDDTVKLGEVLTNQIEIDSLNNEDIDPLPENNIDDAPVPIGRFVYLPVVLKP